MTHRALLVLQQVGRTGAKAPAAGVGLALPPKRSFFRRWDHKEMRRNERFSPHLASRLLAARAATRLRISFSGSASRADHIFARAAA